MRAEQSSDYSYDAMNESFGLYLNIINLFIKFAEFLVRRKQQQQQQERKKDGEDGFEDESGPSRRPRGRGQSRL